MQKSGTSGSPLSPQQKVGFSLLLVVGVTGVIFGFRLFGATIRRPFDERLAVYQQGPKVRFDDESAETEKARQRTSDADEDGLTDYDEISVYKTSAYLWDSDSDGFDDGTEVRTGNDPNCPVNGSCERVNSLPSTSTTSSPSESNVLSDYLSTAFQMDPTALEGVNIESPEDLQTFLSSLGVEEIRSMLMAQGVPAQTLEKLSDEQILEMFQQAMEEVQTEEPLPQDGSDLESVSP